MNRMMPVAFLIAMLISTLVMAASPSDFFFQTMSQPNSVDDVLKGKLAAEVNQLLDSSCSFPVEEQQRVKPYCPIPPKQKNGNNCFPGTIPSFDRHARGYEDYVTAEILKASRQTELFSPAGVSPLLLFSIMAKESFFNPMSYNEWKDMGIAQFQLGTANATLAYMRAVGIEVPAEASDRVPPNCQKNKYSTPLSSACFASIKENCNKAPYMNSLFCPNFAIRLMAFHLLQVQEREVEVSVNNERYSLIPILVPVEDNEASLRHILSVYNRGFRIYNSAYQGFLSSKNWTPASTYGHLWSQERETDNSSDPFSGGTLEHHYINRCYVWAIGGLCGGVKDSIFHQFRQRLCHDRNTEPTERLADDSYRHFVQREFSEAIAALHREIAFSTKMSREQLSRRIRLALNILETGRSVNPVEILEIFNYSLRHPSVGRNIPALMKAYKKALTETPREMNAAITFFDQWRHSKFVDSTDRNAERLAFFRVLQIYGWRGWSENPVAENLPWLYLSGASGFYYFGSGQEDLKLYLEKCAEDDMQGQAVCSYAHQAEQFTQFKFLGQLDKWSRNEN